MVGDVITVSSGNGFMGTYQVQPFGALCGDADRL